MNKQLFEQLHAEELIADSSFKKLQEHSHTKLFSLHWELKTLLYLGVLLLSGGPGVSAFMVEPIAKILSKNYQSILFEQRGTGKSVTNPFDSTTINLKKAAEASGK